MTEISPDQHAQDLADAEAWDAACKRSDQWIRAAMFAQVRQIEPGAASIEPLALGFGALKAVCDYLLVTSRPEAAHVLEQNALAIVRGVMRNQPGPVRDDGTPFVMAHNG